MERFLYSIFAVVGLATLAFGVLSIPFTIMGFVDRSATTEGTVVGVEINNHMEGISYFPTVRFVTEDGRSIVFTSNTSGEWKDRIGESVTVRYDPADPINAKIDSFFQLWGLSVTLLVLGGAFTFVGIRGLRGKLVGSPEPDANRNEESGLRREADHI